MKSYQKDIHFDLISQCKQGHALAFSRIYGLYSKAMFNVALRIVNDQGAAEDVLQDAFVSAFSNLSAFKGESSFGAWLKRIVVNKSINHIHKKKHVLLEEGIPDVVEYTEEPYPAKYSVQAIKEAMKALPDGFRLVFSLYLLEGYDHSEIAEVLNISVSTSKSQLNRAKKKLIVILKSHHNYETEFR